MVEERGLISGTLPFSTVDGPGNRFVVFVQGCTFDCVACHNPYTIGVCDHCGVCLEACVSGALRLEDGRVRWHEPSCGGGGACLSVCPIDSTPKARWLSARELVAQVREAAPFLSGVTVSGGEATRQVRFVRAFFEALASDADLRRLSRFLDTNGDADDDAWDLLEPLTDGAMVDLKAIDDVVHRRITGRSNAAVLRSIERLATSGRLSEIRLLLIPGVNDAPEHLARTAAFVRELGPATPVKVIGFRRHGVRPAARALPEPSAATLHAYERMLRAGGLRELTLV